jgi:hypothetical protein
MSLFHPLQSNAQSEVLQTLTEAKSQCHEERHSPPDGPSVGPGGYKSVVCRGWRYPPPLKASAVEALLNKGELRGGDVVIATYPKCGTTWMQQIVLTLLAGGDASLTRDPMNLSPWPEKLLSLGMISDVDEWNHWEPAKHSQANHPGRRGNPGLTLIKLLIYLCYINASILERLNHFFYLS